MRDSRKAQSFAASKAHPFAAHPLAQLAGAIALGILGGMGFIVQPMALMGFSALTTLGATFALMRQKLRLATLLVMIATFLAGASLAVIEKNRVPANQLKRLLNEGVIAVGAPVELTGVLERDPEIAPERLYLNLRVEQIRFRANDRKASGSVMLLAPIPGRSFEEEFDHLDLRYGARVRIMTMLERSDDFRNPGVSSFTEYLDRKGYDATGFIKSPLLIERLENTRMFLPLAWLYEWRRRLQTEIDSRFSKDTAGVLDAALLGNRYNLSRPTSERFREGGTFHVLVISGLHITFLGGLVYLIARRFTKNRTAQFLLSMAVLWAYSLAVGAEPSVVRAALMFTVVLLAPLVSRRASSLNALGGSALALLVRRPSDLLDPSFQLTFVSVFAIVILAWPLLQKLSEVGSWRPTRETPYPPSCAPWLRSLCECFFWSERHWKAELERTNYSYRLFKAPLATRLEHLHLQGLLRYALGAIVVSGAVQLALLPFLVLYFHRLSIASFLLNIGISLMMAGVAIIAVVGLAAAQLSAGLAAPLIGVTNGLNWLMVHSVDPFAKVGLASIRLPEYTGLASAMYALYYVPLALLVVSLSRWKPLALQKSATNDKDPWRTTRFALYAQLIALALVVAHPLSAARTDGELRIDFLDVGQGDAALVTMPDNTTLLIDGGGRPGPFKNRLSDEDGDEEFERETRSIGEAVVSEYLWWRGLDHVDYILATHADADHIDGLNDVARNFGVRAALIARTPGDDPEYFRFAETMAARGIPLLRIGAGDELRIGGVNARVLWPPPSANPNLPSLNNDSIALRLEFGQRAFLLTGDIEAPAENAILQASDNFRQNLQVDVVKVAHHGSKTSSTQDFIAATRPSFAVISVGQTSVFGHPDRDVVERWQTSGAQVLTTGRSGTITFATNGRDLKLGTFVQDR
ncbi:MAG: ComEC/Rec2 family competence protein [Acidobacteriota bacterium]|nr:ComEC/Rec2 family competence protein [Acidobacteriota bacterium]